MSRSIKPAYLFSPKTLGRRIWMKFFPPDASAKVIRLPWGSAIEIDPTETIGSEIFKQGIFDIGVSECAWRLLQAGDQVIDAGANIGYMTSLFAAKVGKTGVVHSFEPHPQIRKKLTGNIARFAGNGSAAKVIVHECALGDIHGTANLIEGDGFATNQGSAFLGDASATGKGVSHQVEVKPLDEELPVGEFKLLKIDVEGHELKVIQGAERLLGQKRVRHVIFEDHTQGKSGIPEILMRHGYTIYSIGHTFFGLELMDFGKKIVLDTSWESPSYLATIDAGEIKAHISKGWKIFRGVPRG